MVLLGIAALGFGRYPRPGLVNPLLILEDPLFAQILLQLRLPRVLFALLAGAVLGASGFVFQMMFSNPLVEPGFLGVSQGAAFGAALAILMVPQLPGAVQVSAGFFALIGLAASAILARRFHFGGWILRLILAGIAVSALFSSALGVLKYTADPVRQLPEITFWLLGSLGAANWNSLFSILPVTIISLTVLMLFRWRLNMLSLSDRSVFALGMHPRREKVLLILFATISTASVISHTGLVGWAGLIVPHLARRLCSSDARYALPGSMLFGGIYVLVSDTIARASFTGEIPLGVITSAAGAVLFSIFLTRRHAGAAL